jgi:hypothetical protein
MNKGVNNMVSKRLMLGLGIAALCSALAVAQPKVDEPQPVKQEFGLCDWYRGLQEGDCRTKDADFASCLKKVKTDYEACVRKYGK